MQKAVVPLLVCAALQVALGPALRTSTVILGHATDHAHTASFVAEEGHVHLVLSHEGRGHEDRAPAEHHAGPTTSTAESDHVFHLQSTDATSTAPRRAGVPPAPALATAFAILPAPTPPRVQFPALYARTRNPDPLRTVVLRL